MSNLWRENYHTINTLAEDFMLNLHCQQSLPYKFRLFFINLKGFTVTYLIMTFFSV